MGTAKDPSIDQYSRADAGTHCQVDCVLASPRAALPKLAEHTTGAVAVDANGDATCDGAYPGNQRIVLPSRNVWRPYCTGFRSRNSWNRYADRPHRFVSTPDATRNSFPNELSNRFARSPVQPDNIFRYECPAF